MISLITGNPRSGKTYLGVHWLVNNYYQFSDTKLCWEPKIQKKTGEPCIIITDIDSFKLPHKKFDEVLLKTGQTIDSFFTIEFQRELSESYSTVIYFLDEVHRYFPDDFFKKPGAKKVRDYFAYHGHFNQHFWLMTQGTNLIWRDIITLSEVEYRAVPMSLRPPMYFWYRPVVPGTKIQQSGSIKIRHNKKIFAMYKTADRQETQKIGINKMYYYFAACILTIIIGIFYIGYKGYTDYSRLKINKLKNQELAEKKKDQISSQQTASPKPEKKSSFKEMKGYKWLPADQYSMNGKTYILDPVLNEFVEHRYVTPGYLMYKSIPGDGLHYYVYKKEESEILDQGENSKESI